MLSILTEIIAVLMAVLSASLLSSKTVDKLVKNNLSKRKIEIQYADDDTLKNMVKEYIDLYTKQLGEESSENDENAEQEMSLPMLNYLEKQHITIKENALRELYIKRETDSELKKISFILAVAMSIGGTIILFVGIIISFILKSNIGWITVSSGAIIEIVAGVYFRLVTLTMKEVKDNSRQLEKTENLITVMEMVQSITDSSVKDEVYKVIIDRLLPPNDS